LKSRLEKIDDRIKKAASSCGRDPGSIRLVAVSKTMPVGKIQKAFDSGALIFGESYIQEAMEKITALSSTTKGVFWHFIGRLQTNKAKYAVKYFDLIHSVDNLKLAKELSKQAKKIDKIQKILVQVNTGEELSKSGVYEKDAVDLITSISRIENLSVKGLMTIPPFYNEPEKVRPFFASLRSLADTVEKKNLSNVHMDELSMGMTGDFEVAIQEGATLVRIGTAIFGNRN
jgi:pyridoxal phosphate enzyme (YggS family)